jgi:pyrroline-5-carboxylate reductase
MGKTSLLKVEKIGFIGAGNMARAIIEGLILSKAIKPNQIYINDKNRQRKTYAEKKFKVKSARDNRQLIDVSSVVVICVKPRDVRGVLEELSCRYKEEKLIISIAAGIKLNFLRNFLSARAKLVRVMPNIGSLVQESISVISYGPFLDSKSKKIAQIIFGAVGEVEEINERQMDAVTSLSGSGPAYLAYILNSLIKASQRKGLSKSKLKGLTFQMAEGTIKLLKEKKIKPENLIKMVASKGGTTEAALDVFKAKKLDKIISEAVKAAEKRAKKLSGG